MAAAKKTPKKPVKPVKAGTSKESSAQRRTAFVQAYLSNGGNATEAAKTAGFSAKTAHSQGSRLLKVVEVQAALAKVGENLAKKYELSVEMIERSIAQEIRFDPAKLYRPDGTIKDVPELDEDTRMALASLETVTEGNPKDGFTYVRKIKWAARQGAREQAMKYLGMFEKDNTQKSPLNGMPYEAMEAARQQLVALLAKSKPGKAA